MKRIDLESLDLPHLPGVYFFKQKGEIVYIGKATNLKQRVGSYFSPTLMETRGPVIEKMVEDSTSIEFTTTESVLEALLLESQLIKKHQPIANTKEKDDKSYNYVVITDESYPRVFSMRKRQLDIAQGRKEPFLYVFGPFPQGQLLREALNVIRKIFPFYGKQGRGGYADEFYHQLGLVPHSSSSHDSYRDNIHYLALFFQGKKKTIIKLLKKKMEAYAKELAFEKAEVIKRQIHSLTHIHDIALMRRDFELGTIHTNDRLEAYDIAHHQGDDMVGVMVVHQGGELQPQEYRTFTIRSVEKANDTKALAEVLTRRLDNKQWPYPDCIIVDGGIAQKRVMERVLREHNVDIAVVSVVKDETHKAKSMIGKQSVIARYQRAIIAINHESHRFAITTHKKRRGKRFLDK